MPKKFTLVFLYMLSLIQFVYAQDGNSDFLRSTGKIYVVVCVLVIIFLALIFYLFRLDRKIRKLEKRIENEQ
jgi:CcmD family protein